MRDYNMQQGTSKEMKLNDFFKDETKALLSHFFETLMVNLRNTMTSWQALVANNLTLTGALGLLIQSDQLNYSGYDRLTSIKQ